MILNVSQIDVLDDKEIKKNEVDFIRNWHQFRIEQESRSAFSREQSFNPKNINYISYADVQNVESK